MSLLVLFRSAPPPSQGSATGTFTFAGAAVGVAPTPLTYLSDNFNRANEALSAGPWAVIGSGPPSIVGNEVVGGSAITLGVRHTTATNTDNQFSEAVYRGGTLTGVAVALDGFASGSGGAAAGAWYVFRQQALGGPSAILAKNAGAATMTSLVSGGPTLVSGDVMRLEYSAGVLTAYVNGAQVLTVTPGSPITGQRYVGFHNGSTANNGVAILDSWVGGDIGATPPPVLPPSGTAAGTWTFAGSAVGKRTPKATAAGTFAFVGAASGKRTPKATGSGTFTFTGAATGKRTPKATGAGTFAYTGAAVGAAPVVQTSSGTASGTFTFTGSATGKRAPRATAAGTFAFVGTAVGKRAPKATASGTFTFTGAATGKRTSKGSAGGTFAFSGSATGKRSPKATAAGTETWTGAAVGFAPIPMRTGTASGTVAWSGSATGKRPARGSATGLATYTGAAVGKRVPKAAVVGTVAYQGTATGRRQSLGAAVGVFAFTGAAVGLRLARGATTGTTVWLGTAEGRISVDHRNVDFGGNVTPADMAATLAASEWKSGTLAPGWGGTVQPSRWKATL